MILNPTEPYNGITIVLSEPSRFDRENNTLLCGTARKLVADTIHPFSIGGTEVRLCYKLPFRDGTRFVILAGSQALQFHLHKFDLNAERGYIQPIKASENSVAAAVATFAPQDACDLRDYESDDEADEEEESAADTGKDSSPTAWRNYRFWFRADVKKLLFRSIGDTTYRQPIVIPTRGELVELSSLRGRRVFIDIETHPASNTAAVVGLAVEDGLVYTLPIYDYRGRLAADGDTIVALARILSRNTLVLHNAGFDLPFLAVYHRLPFSRFIEDTMLMHHRTYPESEKSLAHCISFYLNQPYHKDEGIFYPRNEAQQTQLWTYNAKDVAATREIWRRQQAAASHDQGLSASFQQVNAAIYPYLLMGLFGIGVSYSREMSRLRDELSRKERQYRRIINILSGRDLNPRSSKKCIEYFHEALGYPPVKRSELTGAPSLAGDALYVLKTKTDNPIIEVILAARGVGKKLSMLEFRPLVWVNKR